MVISLPFISIKNKLSEMCFSTRYGPSYGCSKECFTWSTLTNTCVVLNILSKMKYERLEWCLVGLGRISCMYFLNLSTVKSVCVSVSTKNSPGILRDVSYIAAFRELCHLSMIPLDTGWYAVVRMCLHPINFASALNIWDSNWAPRSVVMVDGALNLAIQLA